MSRAGYTEEEIRPTLAYLEAKGYLNDEVFAREVARASSDRKHWGPLRIQRKLRDLRLEDRDIEGALDEVFPKGPKGPEGEEEAARRAFERFRRIARAGEGERARARAYRHLIGRGFSSEVVHRLVSSWNFGDTDHDRE